MTEAAPSTASAKTKCRREDIETFIRAVYLLAQRPMPEPKQVALLVDDTLRRNGCWEAAEAQLVALVQALLRDARS